MRLHTCCLSPIGHGERWLLPMAEFPMADSSTPTTMAAPLLAEPGAAGALEHWRRRFLSTGADRRARTLPSRKAVIVGCGAVGMASAVAILHRGCLEELVLVDVATERLEGEVMDLCHGLPFLPRTDLRAGVIGEEGADADLVVVTAGLAQKPGQSRLELIAANADLFRRIIPEVARHCPRAVLLILSNPVDVLTHIAAELSGFPHHRVIGSGTVLDSARFRMAISRRLGIDPLNVHAYVIGEHGDTEVPVWSRVEVGGLAMGATATAPLQHEELQAIFHAEVRQAAYEIIRRKGSTSWAIGMATAEIVEAVLRSREQILTVSGRTYGAYGLPDVTLSLPTVVNDTGAVALLDLPLSAEEHSQLHHSANVLRSTLQSVGF